MAVTVVSPAYHQHRYARELDRWVTPGCAWLDIGAGRCIHGGSEGPSCDDLARRVGYLAGCGMGDDLLLHPHLHERRIADATSLPWESRRFDLVTANMVLGGVADPGAVFREVYRVLRAGGVFLFVTTNLNHPVIRLAAAVIPPGALKRFVTPAPRRATADDPLPHFRCNTVKTVKKLACASGFVPESVESFRSTRPVLPARLGRIETRVLEMAARFGLGMEPGADLIAVLRKPAGPRLRLVGSGRIDPMYTYGGEPW